MVMRVGLDMRKKTDGLSQMSEIELICSDSVEWMQRQPSEIADLIIADPPYSLGKQYGNNSDKLEGIEQTEFMIRWVDEAIRILKPNGSIFVFMGFRHIAKLYTHLEGRGLLFRNWICWHYTQGMGKTRGFSPRHDDILVFSKGEKFTFNLDDIRVPQKYYRSVNNMRGANPGDVWEFSHIHYCQENRQDHPTQKPEGLIERIVRASSNKDDMVIDPFLGSGTTARVCQQLNRNCIGIEINADYVEMAKRRLEQKFGSFDSIDPRMKRVPFDLRDTSIRSEYIKSHISWFLDKHETDISDFFKEVDKLYGSSEGAAKKRGRPKKATETMAVPFLFE